MHTEYIDTTYLDGGIWSQPAEMDKDYLASVETTVYVRSTEDTEYVLLQSPQAQDYCLNYAVQPWL